MSVVAYRTESFILCTDAGFAFLITTRSVASLRRTTTRMPFSFGCITKAPGKHTRPFPMISSPLYTAPVLVRSSSTSTSFFACCPPSRDLFACSWMCFFFSFFLFFLLFCLERFVHFIEDCLLKKVDRQLGPPHQKVSMGVREKIYPLSEFAIIMLSLFTPHTALYQVLQ